MKSKSEDILLLLYPIIGSAVPLHTSQATTNMPPMSRTPSKELPQLSIEDTYSLAYVARRKSSTGSSKTDLRQRLGTAQLLEALENAIRNSPPPSPQPTYRKTTASQHISWASLEAPKQEAKPEFDDYGFAYYDDEEDDSLSLCRTQSRSS